MSDRPITTLFMLCSLDGKISTGDVDDLDVDKDFPHIQGVKEGLQQYYDLERQTDRVSLNSGKVQAKIGANNRTWDKARSDVSFVIIDNEPHLNEQGVTYFANRSEQFYVLTSNKQHPALALKQQYPTMHILFYEGTVNFVDAFHKLKAEFGVERMTIQTGGTLNAVLLRLGLIDHVSLVIAPCLVGGDDTASIIGGKSLHTQQDLLNVKALRIVKSQVLENSYLHVTYDVINETKARNILD